MVYLYNDISTMIIRGFPTRKLYLYNDKESGYTILVGNPRHNIVEIYHSDRKPSKCRPCQRSFSKVIMGTAAMLKLMTCHLSAQGPLTAYSGQKVAVKVSFTCPFTLTNCLFYMEGDLDVHRDDTNDFTHRTRRWEDEGKWTKKIG